MVCFCFDNGRVRRKRPSSLEEATTDEAWGFYSLKRASVKTLDGHHWLPRKFYWGTFAVCVMQCVVAMPRLDILKFSRKFQSNSIENSSQSR